MTAKVTHDGERWSNAADDAIEIVRRSSVFGLLRANPDEARRYEALKRELAAKFATDREGYTTERIVSCRTCFARQGLHPADAVE